MLKLHFITTGIMIISLEGLKLGDHLKDPTYNIKSYLTKPDQIILEAKEMKFFTDWGCIVLDQAKKDKQGRVIEVSIDSETWGWYSTAQIVLERNGQIIFNDNFQSGTRGPIGDPKRFKSYPVLQENLLVKT